MNDQETTNDTQSDLDKRAQAMFRINAVLINAAAQLRPHGNPSIAADLIETARQIAWAEFQDALRAGATERDEWMPDPDELTWSLRNSPANRQLLSALTAARTAAIAVDRERESRYYASLPKLLEHLCDNVRDEIAGPMGIVRE